MPLLIVRNDITTMPVDAIVSAADPSLSGGGGVDAAIHRAAGPELLAECRALGGCAVGEAKSTGAYRLPCRRVIHTVGPKWHGGLFGEGRQLRACYRACLELALREGCETVAFPLISAGTCGYPAGRALRAATEAIAAFLSEHEMTVYLVVCGENDLAPDRRLFAEIRAYIDERYVEQRQPLFRRQAAERKAETPGEPAAFLPAAAMPAPKASARPARPLPRPRGAAAPLPPESVCDAAALPQESACNAAPDGGLERLLGELDESFQQMLLRKIDESGMSDAECYKRANLDRKHFSKIRGDVHYRPKKTTALAFAVALRLDLAETQELLRKAGYALSRSSKFDVIVQYFIEHRNYNIFAINEALFFYDQSLLGG